MPDKICFTSIDVEHDFGEPSYAEASEGKEERKFQGVEKLDRILEIFKKYNVPATLFVTGEVLERYSDAVKEWGCSYEIACHSFTHRFWTPPARHPLNYEERNKEIEDFINLYQRVFNKEPKGFRAPSHLIDKEGLALLGEKRFLYDSSVVPHYPFFRKYRGYKGRRPLVPHYPGAGKILEIPVAGQIFGIPLVWVRKLPPFFYKILFVLHKPSLAVLNLHSWDALNSGFLQKLEDILKLLKNNNYQFLNGEQIYKNWK